MTPNDLIKMKVLQGLKSHMDNKIGEGLKSRFGKPKAGSVEKVTVAPGNPSPGASEASAPSAPEIPGTPSTPDMSDDDTKRLMDLYGSLK